MRLSRILSEDKVLRKLLSNGLMEVYSNEHFAVYNIQKVNRSIVFWRVLNRKVGLTWRYLLLSEPLTKSEARKIEKKIFGKVTGNIKVNPKKIKRKRKFTEIFEV